MNLLTEIEGTKAETLTSRLLRHLLIDCEPFRSRLAELLVREVLQSRGALTFSDGVICKTEVATYCSQSNESKDKQNGRIDILIESDGHVIFIENKLWASFQDDQPEKYCFTLDKTAATRGKRGLLVVLCPEFRVREVRKKLAQKRKADSHVFAVSKEERRTVDYFPSVITWQAVTSILREIGEQALSVTSGVVVNMFAEYVSSHLYGDIPRPSEDARSLMTAPIVGKWGNNYQNSLLSMLRYWFASLEGVQAGKSYTGENKWYGFDVTVEQGGGEEGGKPKKEYWIGITNFTSPREEGWLVLASKQEVSPVDGLTRSTTTPVGWREGWNVFLVDDYWKWTKLAEAAKAFESILP